MGFECGFGKVLKYKDTTLQEYFDIKSYISWKNNDWNHQEDRYPTWEKYWNAFCKGFRDTTRVFPGEPDMDKVNFYETMNTESDTIDTWYSRGRDFDEYLITHLEELEDTSCYPIHRNFVENVINEIESRRSRYDFKQAIINYSFKLTELDSILLAPCDGIEATIYDRNGNYQTKRITSDSDFEEPTLFYCEDEELHYVYEGLSRALDIIDEIDLDKYLVWYWRSY